MAEQPLTGHAGCPECGSAVERVHVAMTGTANTYIYQPCGHGYAVALGANGARLNSFVMRVTPEDLKDYTADAQRSRDSARALGIGVLFTAAAMIALCGILAWLLILN